MECGIQIRCAVLDDLGAILRIEDESHAAAHWSEADYAHSVVQSERLVLVSEESGEISGFLVASTATLEWELENIAVRSDRQRKGVGRSLLTALISRAKAAGATEIRQEIRASNLAAQHLGHSVGFIERGRRKSYYRDPQEDALLFNYLVPAPLELNASLTKDGHSQNRKNR